MPWGKLMKITQSCAIVARSIAPSCEGTLVNDFIAARCDAIAGVSSSDISSAVFYRKWKDSPRSTLRRGVIAPQRVVAFANPVQRD